MARSWKHVILAVFLLMFWDRISAEDQKQQTLEVSVGGVLVLTFQPFDRNKMFLVKRKEGEVTNIKVRTWSSWTAGSVPNLTDQASDDPAFDGRVDSTYVNVSNTLTVRIKDFRAADTGPGVYYEFQQSGRRSPKFYPNIQVPPPPVPMFTITESDVGVNYVNITFQQVEPWDSAPVNYSVQYQETGVAMNGTWNQTDTLQHNSSLSSRQINVEGLRPGVGYKFKIVSVNRFGSSFSDVEEATTKVAGSGLSPGALAAIIIVVILLALGIAVAVYNRQYICEYCWFECLLKRCGNKSKRTKKPDGSGKKTHYEPVPTKDTVVNIPADECNSRLVTAKSPSLTEADSASNGTGVIAGNVLGDGQKPDVDAGPTNHGKSHQKDETKPGERSDTDSHDNKKAVHQYYGLVTQHHYHGKVDQHHYHGKVDQNFGPVTHHHQHGDIPPESGGGVWAEVPVAQPATVTDGKKSESPKTKDDSSGLKTADNVEKLRLSESQGGVIAPPVNNDAPKTSSPEEKIEEIFANSKSGNNADSITDLLKLLRDADNWAMFRLHCGVIDKQIHLPNLCKLTAQGIKAGKVRTVGYKNIPPNHLAVETTGNGDCLFNAVSLLLTGTEDHATLLRLGAAVYAGLNLKFIVEEFSQALSPSKEKAVDSDTALAFMTAMCDAEVVDGCPFPAGSDPTDVLEYAVREEARRTTHLGNYSGRLQIKFLSGFVKHNIHLSCEDPETESCGYHDVLHTPSLDGDNLPELRIMMVYFDKKSTSLNHYVGLVEKDKDAVAIGNSTLYDEVTRLAEVTKMIGEDHADRKFVARAAQELGFTKEMAEDLIQFHSSRNVLIKLSQLWIKKVESGDAKFNATLLDKLERVFTVARSSISISNGQSPDADDDASKDEAGTNCTSQANNADPRYGKLMMMVKECDLGKDEENARKFVKAVADRLKIRIGENFFKDRNSTRVALEEVIVLWDRDIGEYATPPLLEQAFFDARKPSNLPSDVESDAEIDESEKDITVEVSEPSASRDLEAAVFNDRSQTGPEVLEEATEAVLDAEIQELAALRKDTSTAPGSDQSTSTQGSSPPKGSDINIWGNVKNLQVGDYNEMNVGGARPKTSLNKKAHSKGTSQGKNGHRKPQNTGTGIGKLTIDGDVGNMQSGDHNVMYITPQSGPDTTNNNVDTGDASSSTRVVTEEDFQEIQEHVGLKWKDVARLLGLTEGQIDGVEHDHRDKPLDEKVYQMLRKWKQQKGESATVSALKQALIQAGLDDVACRIQQ